MFFDIFVNPHAKYECELFQRSSTLHGNWNEKREKCFKDVGDPFSEYHYCLL